MIAKFSAQRADLTIVLFLDYPRSNQSNNHHRANIEPGIVPITFTSAKSKKDYTPLPCLICTTIDTISIRLIWVETTLGQSSGYVHVSHHSELDAGFWGLAISSNLVNRPWPDKGLSAIVTGMPLQKPTHPAKYC